MNKNKLKTKTQDIAVIATLSLLLFFGLISGLIGTLNLIEKGSYKSARASVNGFETIYISIKTAINGGVTMESLLWNITVPKTKAEEKPTIKDWSVQDKIVYYADIYGVDKDTALRIAKCESNFNPKAENVNGSATGVYQFIRKTWKNYCEGDVYDADANIICFARMYSKHPDWWECE